MNFFDLDEILGVVWKNGRRLLAWGVVLARHEEQGATLWFLDQAQRHVGQKAVELAISCWRSGCWI